MKIVMAKFTFADMQRRWQQQDRERHKALLRKVGKNAFGTIKTQLPEGTTLREYIDELYAEIEAEKEVQLGANNSNNK